MLLITNSRTSSLMAEKNQNGLFIVINLTTSKAVHVSCSNWYCMLLITSSRTSLIMVAGYCRVALVSYNPTIFSSSKIPIHVILSSRRTQRKHFDA